jgi:acyl-CoA thioester hydrolase
MERSRTEFFRERGIELTAFHDRGFQFVVVEAHCRYRAPARYNDLLEVQSRLGEVSAVSIEFLTDIYNAKNVLLVTGKVRIACVNETGSACRAPDDLLRALSSAS